MPGSGGPDRHSCWLTTLNADGSPHVTGLGVLWVDGHLWFETGRTTRKGRNLARDPRCALSVSTSELDLVVEGRAALVTDPATVGEAGPGLGRGAARRGRRERVRVDGTVHRTGRGPPQWHVYRVDAPRHRAGHRRRRRFDALPLLTYVP